MDEGLPEASEPSLAGEERNPVPEESCPMETVPSGEKTTATESQGGTVTEADTARVGDDDDVVLVETTPPAKESGTAPLPAIRMNSPADSPTPKPTGIAEEVTTATAPVLNPSAEDRSETIVIDDEEDALSAPAVPQRALSSTEPDSEIRIASVTTLGTPATQTPPSVALATVAPGAGSPARQQDMNLMITSVTSLQDTTPPAGGAAEVENGLQISSTFSLNPEAQDPNGEPPVSGRPSTNTGSSGTFNPGRVSTAREPVQNGETGTHQKSDSWISQSASFPRNQKQPGADSPSPAAPLPKPPARSPLGPQPPPRAVKVTCANCKKPLKKGQTAYQRKGSAHLFCSTTCLSAFSHRPAPKKNCTMCKKDITSMKGTIVAQVDSSESFQEFCSTGCLASYENKQNPPKTPVKTKCTVCGKLTEIRHEVSFKNVTHKICSDMCFNRYRMANGLIMNCCEQCGDYLPSRASANHFLVIDGQQKRFCCQNCVRDYKQAHGKLTNCSGCKAPCRSFDVTHCIGPSGTMEPYCSTTCMTAHKSKAPVTISAEPSCHFCKRNALPQYQATLPDGKVYSFCSSNCVTKFQNANVATPANGQPARPSAPGGIQLKCNYCRGAFSLKPETLEWENKVYQFCSKTCCEDYKKLHCIVTFCEYCQEEKTLHETVKFSGVKRPFCSEGCKLLFKQDFARRLGLKCVTCNYCSQMCKRGIIKQVDNLQRDFCSEACAKKFHDWYYKAARCDCCKVQGSLTESVQWRGEVKHFCDQQCLLRFYCQQNEPNMATQKGPENMFGYGALSQGTKNVPYNQAPLSTFGGAGLLKDAKNKAVLCKPLTMTKATYCKPHMQSKHCQTEETDSEMVKKEYVPVPIPVPVYVPVPMNMYAQTTPVPVTVPVPVPVPVFLPTTLHGAEKIVKTISELRAKVPSNTVEVDLLTMTDAMAEADEEKPDCKDLKCESVKMECVKEEQVKAETDGSSSSDEEENDDSYDPELDLEIDVPQVPGLDPATEFLEAEIGFTLPPVLGEEKEDKPRPAVRRKGHKRRAVEAGGVSPPPSPNGSAEGAPCPLKPQYGVNAWKRWVLTSAGQAQDTTKEQLKLAKPVRLKRNLLSLGAAELSHALSRFVSEVRRPNGDSYAPDSIFYLCLGIQQHLHDNGRMDDIFSDPCYQQFGQELNKVLNGWQPSVLPDGSLWSRVEEQCLWHSKQLGSHSPAALLRSLVYLNTKYFGLRTVEQHLRLSFANVYRERRAGPQGRETRVCICIPSISLDHQEKTGSGKRKRRDEESDPDEGPGGSSRCPVKKHECRLYELYLSKCPASLKQRTDMFYVKPDAFSSSDSPLWYSTVPLERSSLEGLLARALLTRDIYSERGQSDEEEEEDDDGGDQ
ncbi:zinc finger MYM-type protein 2 [Brienomyrus brachyistius]|uniref:zinc finger MYM-type protein 2 n=1 Tax=Brienomyrus brachyistius TaxID=42636 RepID=UPI0020B23A88|nr:zinc finger MYM-type protein 2 [Brienomyrus brachyistius]